MKNLINLKSILAQSIWFAGILILVTSCSDNKTVDSKEVAEQENIAKLVSDDQKIVVIKKDFDAKFLMNVAEMQLEEINLGKLAQQKGSSPHVKELGRMMVEEHSQSFAEIKTLAESKYITIPTAVTQDSKDVYEKMNEKSGNDFGKAYSDLMVKNHEDAIDLYEKASTDAEDPEIRVWASNKLPTLRTHLKHAEACKKECEKMKS